MDLGQLGHWGPTTHMLPSSKARVVYLAVVQVRVADGVSSCGGHPTRGAAGRARSAKGTVSTRARRRHYELGRSVVVVDVHLQVRCPAKAVKQERSERKGGKD
jgi:hypothetical protein